MLKIHIKETELYDEKTESFISVKPVVLTLEHSLVSISKWEAKWKKAFLSKKDKSNKEFVSYVRCMTISQNIDPNAYLVLSQENVNSIIEYIEDPMTSLIFNKDNRNKRGINEVVTSELIYYWMTVFNIPIECQKWHLNRLLALIKVCNIKNSKPKKMSKREILSRNAELNAQRRAMLNTKG